MRETIKKKWLLYVGAMMMALCFCMMEAPECQATTYNDYTNFDYTKVQRGDTITGLGRVMSVDSEDETKIEINGNFGGDNSFLKGCNATLVIDSQKTWMNSDTISLVLDHMRDENSEIVIPKRIANRDIDCVEISRACVMKTLDISQTNVKTLTFRHSMYCKYLMLNQEIRSLNIIGIGSGSADQLEYAVIPKGDNAQRTKDMLSKFRNIEKKIISQNEYKKYVEKGLSLPDKRESLTIDKSQRKMGSYIYAYVDDDTCQVISYRGIKENLKIPDTFDSKKVVKVSDNFLSKNDKVKTLTMPNTVTEIDSKAFNECTKLTTVNMSASIEKIGNEAFNGCTQLSTINFPETLKTIEPRAFKGCTKLPSVTIPKKVTFVGENAFDGCSALSTVKINSNGANFTENVFRSTPWLKGKTANLVVEGNSFIHKNKDVEGEYTVPTGCTVIPNWAFCQNSKLTKITIPDTVTNIGDFAFLRCNGLKELTIPGSVKKICEVSFGECSKLEKVVISEGVETLFALNGGKYNGLFSRFQQVSGTINSSGGIRYCAESQNAFKELYLPYSLKKFYFTRPTTGQYSYFSMFLLGENKNLVVYVPENSYAQKFCKENKLNWALGSAGNDDDEYRAASGSTVNEDDTSINKDARTTSKAPITIVICVIVVLAAGAGVVIYKKKKKSDK